ncbi:hypothetical protein [Nakamurella panacisegetis]|uniref:hypothetical protein n=1 Tax=Nakamurella panacisegetis TaxID=1090615 RepID=UPI001E4FF0FF|nr:hypothetical protein [Nakamurella panacisegetis]
MILPFATEITNGWAGDMFDVPKAGLALTEATGGRTTELEVVGVLLVSTELTGADAGADPDGPEEAGVETLPTVIGAPDGAADETDSTDEVEPPEEPVAVVPLEVQAVTSTARPRSAAMGARRRAEDM